MKRKEVKIAFLIYMIVQNHNVKKSKLRAKLSDYSGYRVSHSYFENLYDEAMKILQESKIFSSAEKSKKASENGKQSVLKKDTEDGYKYYDFMDTKVWVDFDKFDRFLKKKYNTDSVEDVDYKLRWYENLLLLNVYYNEMMEKKQCRTYFPTKGKWY